MDTSDSARTADSVRASVAKYNEFWRKRDSSNGDAERLNRLENYTDMTNSYYDGATDLYEWGWGQSFHFARFFRGESFAQSLARYEHYLALRMGLKAGMRVLDVGCGVGGPAREIANFADVHIVGLNNSEYQVHRARKYSECAGMSHMVTFEKGDFMKLSEQFASDSFDAVYAIEATVHAPSFEDVYFEIIKVLKPGGIFGVYEWCMTDAWDPSIPEHKALAHGIERGDGIPEIRPIATVRQALIKVGFTILHEEDLAARGDSLPWYYPLEGDLCKAQTLWDYFTAWRLSWSGRIISRVGMRVLDAVGLVPRGMYSVNENLKIAADALVAAGQQKLFTPMLLMVCRKPEDWA